MITDRTTYTNSNAKHAYEIGVGVNREEARFEVHANNRAQAARRLEKEGHTIRDVNMIG
jgi:hypothetical protein